MARNTEESVIINVLDTNGEIVNQLNVND